MNDIHHTCENWAEQISLAAAGCLSADEEQEVHRHIETCSNCRERFQQLTELCGALAELQLPAAGTEAAIVQRVMSVVASGCERSLQDRHSERRIRHSERRIRHSERSEESDSESPSNKILRCAQNDSVARGGGDDSSHATYPFTNHMEVDYAFPGFPRCDSGHFRSRRYRSRLVVPRRRHNAGLRRLRQADPRSEATSSTR